MNFRRVAAAAALVAVGNLAQAALIDNGNGTVYDNTQNITWLQDWSVNGRQDLATQNTWASDLTFAGSSAWALPDNGQYNGLFAEFGDLRSASLPFTNVQAFPYWTSTVWEFGGDNGWRFRPDDGDLNGQGSSFPLYAVAVAAGNVSAIPEPETGAMMLLALGALAVAVRRRPR
jgi:hypothetical protein